MTPLSVTMYGPDGSVIYQGTGQAAAVVHQGIAVPVQARAPGIFDGLAGMLPTGLGGPHGTAYPGETWVSDELDSSWPHWSDFDSYEEQGSYYEQAIRGDGERMLGTMTRMNRRWVHDEQRTWQRVHGGWELRETRVVTYGDGHRAGTGVVTVGSPVRGSLDDLVLDGSGEPFRLGPCFNALGEFDPTSRYCPWQMFRSTAYLTGTAVTGALCSV